MDVFENDSESDVVLYALKTEAPFVYIVLYTYTVAYSTLNSLQRKTLLSTLSLYEKEVPKTRNCRMWMRSK